MARSLNMVMLIGNVGAEPEIRTASGGTRMAKFSLATSSTYTDRSGQQQEKTQWHNLTCWERLAEIVEQYVHKGDKLHIVGRIEYSQTEDDRGNVRYWTNIIVRELIMLGSPGGGGGGGYPQQQRRPLGSPRPPAQQQQGGHHAPPPSPFDQDDDDDLPF